MNVTYGEGQKDIDHLVFTSDSVIMNECKNTKGNFYMWYSWFLSHVVDRFADGLPVAQFYARSFGYSFNNITFTLTISRLNAEFIVFKAIEGLKIRVIQTGKQLLNNDHKKRWYTPIRRQILSVINNTTSKYSPFYNVIRLEYNNEHILLNTRSDTIQTASNGTSSQGANRGKKGKEPETETEKTSDSIIIDSQPETQIPQEIMRMILETSKTLIFPFNNFLKIYVQELDHLKAKSPNEKQYCFVLRVTRMKIKNKYRKIHNCQYCLHRNNYGCTLFRLFLGFRGLLGKAVFCSEIADNHEFLEEIGLEFMELYEKTIKCVNKRTFQCRRLGYPTMDFDLPRKDLFKKATYQQTLDPANQIRNELEMLKKRKEELRGWKLPRKLPFD
jgi:hypothetical protein